MSSEEKCPWFPFYHADWLSSTAVDDMTFDQQGRYVRALALSWGSDSPGVAPEDCWRRWMKLTLAQWAKQREKIAAAFTVTDGGVWVQERLKHEHEKILERRARAAFGAAKTNRKRWAKSHEQVSHSDDLGIA